MIPIAKLHLADVVDRHVFSVAPHSTLASMIERMKAEHVSHVVVLDGAKPVGMLTERDLVRLLHQRVDRSRLVREYMSTPVTTVPGALGFRSAYIQLCLSRLRHLVVVDNDGLVIGVAAERDFLGHLGMELFQNIRSLRDLIDKTVPRLPPAMPVADAIDLMVREKRGCVVVAEENRFVGVFTENQVPTVLARHQDGSAVTLKEVMRTTLSPITDSISIAEVMAQMVADRIGYVVVVDEDAAIVGIIAQSRLLENVRTAVYAEMATRQLVEDQLHQVEAQLEATLEHTPNIAVQWYDREGCVHYWNHASETLYGWTAIEAMGKTLDQLVLTAEEAAEFKKLLAEIELSGKTLGPMEYRTRNRQGEPRWVEATMFPIPGECTEEPFFVCMDVDVSKRKRTERALFESDYKHRALADRMPLAIQVFSPEGVVLQVNKAWEKMWHSSLADLKGYRVLEDRQLAAAGILPLLQQAFAGQSVTFPVHVYDRARARGIAGGDDKIWIRAFAYPVLSEDGRVLEVVVVQEDVTERRKTEEQLRKLAQAIEQSPESIVITNLDAEIEYVNNAFVRATGYLPEQVVGQNPRVLNSGKTPQSTFTDLWATIKSGRVWNGEFQNRRKDGSEYIEHAIIAPVRQADGTITHYVAVKEDITERKAAEAALRKSQDSLKEAQRIAQIGNWELDLLENRLTWSDEIFRIFEIDQGRFSATYEAFLAIIHPDDRAEVNATYTRSLETQEPYAITHRLLMPDGRIKYVHEQCESYFDNQGRPVRSVGTVQDVTERKLVDLELKQYREHLEELVADRTADLQENHRQLTQIQFALDRVGIGIAWNDVESGRFVYANNETCRQLGYTHEEFLQLTVSDINPAYSPAAVRQASLDVMESGLPVHIDTVHRRKDGSSFPVDVTIYAFRDGDRLLSIAFHQDISGRKLAEDELRRAKEAAEAASVAKSAFLANMSHEIRTPLNGILGLARISARENAGRKAGEISRKILKAGQHLVGVIDDILDFSKLEAGKLVIVPSPLSLALLVEEALGLVAERAAEKMLPLTRRLAPDLPQWVIGDPLRIRQILANLLSNAVKFAEKGEVVLDVRRAGNEILFSVSDSGIGMSPEQLAKLFQPFQQADNSITRKFGGTGLGLAISMNLARMMGGAIEVSSQPGRGSTFTLRIALPETTVQPSSECRSIHGKCKRLEGLRVLVAEDIEINREVLDDMLTCEGAICLMVANGQEAVSTIAEDPSGFDVVLMDIQMPVMDGREAARQIRVIAPALPIIALTAHALQEERELSRMAGMVDHLSKPIDPAELVRVVLAQTGMTVMARDAPVQPVSAVAAIQPVQQKVFPSVTPIIEPEVVLPSLPELDVETGLHFLGGDPTRYRRMLDKFVEQHAQDAEQIRAAMAASKPDEARRLVHGLKSVAATLGATSLSEAAYELEQRLKAAMDNRAQQTDVERPLTALDAALVNLVKGIRKATKT